MASIAFASLSMGLAAPMARPAVQSRHVMMSAADSMCAIRRASPSAAHSAAHGLRRPCLSLPLRLPSAFPALARREGKSQEVGMKTWDPLGLADLGSPATLAFFRHSELKHCRVRRAAGPRGPWGRRARWARVTHDKAVSHPLRSSAPLRLGRWRPERRAVAGPARATHARVLRRSVFGRCTRPPPAGGHGSLHGLARGRLGRPLSGPLLLLRGRLLRRHREADAARAGRSCYMICIVEELDVDRVRPGGLVGG